MSQIDDEWNKRIPLVSIIVPCYNEEKTIDEVISRLISLKKRISMEIIIVDDGSSDNTAKIVSMYSQVKYVRHNTNYGKGAAIKSGLKYSNGEIIVIQDADMEYFPEQIPRLLKPFFDRGVHVVYGSRFIGKIEGMTYSHMLGNKILSLVTQILYGKQITDVMTGYKVFSRKIFELIDLSENDFEIEVEITSKILKNNIELVEVPISYIYRKKGVSKINFWHGLTCLIKLFSYKLNNI